MIINLFSPRTGSGFRCISPPRFTSKRSDDEILFLYSDDLTADWHGPRHAKWKKKVVKAN